MSINVTITADGAKDLGTRLRSINFDLPITRALLTIAAQANAIAQMNAPVLTGFLLSTINFTVTGNHAVIGSRGCPYAHFQEFGTRYMRAQPFIRPAMAAVTPTAQTELSRECIAEIESKLGGLR